MADDEDARIQLTIKNVRASYRERMNGLAKKRGQTLGDWQMAMIDLAAKMQAGDLVSPALFQPPALPQPAAAAAAAAAALAAPVPFSMAELRDTMHALGAVSQATGVAIPKVTARLAYAVVTKQLRHAKGMLEDAVGHTEAAGPGGGSEPGPTVLHSTPSPAKRRELGHPKRITG